MIFPWETSAKKTGMILRKLNLSKKRMIAQKKSAFLEKKKSSRKGKEKKILEESLLQLSKSSKFIEEVFPMDAILIKRELSGDKKKILEEKLHEKIALLLKKCGRLIRG